MIKLKLGVDVFLKEYISRFSKSRIGLVTNMTGVNEKLQSTIDLFNKHPDIHLVALYGPEHGIRGDVKEGEKIISSTDPYTKLPVYSLYGADRKPTKEMLDGVDVIVFDLQDIGARYYTYIYTMAYVMEACAEHGKHFVVLDRPNPISGNNMEGNLIEKDLRSFVGLYPIPNRHGMTIAELALLFKHEFNINCEMTIVPMEGWKRSMYFDHTSFHWVAPSPNTTGIDMNILYPGTCLAEGTNLSEGRGTTRPFECIGAPYIDGYKLANHYNAMNLPGVIARPTSFIPDYQKHEGEVCYGVQLHITNRNSFHSLEAGVMLIEKIAEMYPNQFEFTRHGAEEKYFFDLLAGTKETRSDILKGNSRKYIESCYIQLEEFNKQRDPYLLYK